MTAALHPAAAPGGPAALAAAGDAAPARPAVAGAAASPAAARRAFSLAHPLVPWLAGLAGALAYAALGTLWHEGGAGWLAASAAAGIAAGLLARLAAELVALRELERGILNAREGLLVPASGRGLGWTLAGRLIPEHNQTVAALGLMFRTVEECQLRFLGQRNRVTTILQTLPGAVLGLTDELSVSFANRQAATMFGAEADSLVGRALFDLVRPDERGRALLRDAFLYKHGVVQQEFALDVAGHPRQVAISLAFYSEAEDDDIAGVMTLQDVTEQRMLMQTVAVREKLVAMGQLAAGVAHELNTPLGNILGYAQLLRATPLTDTGAGYADIVAAEARRCSRVVQDLLTYARKDDCSGDSCDVNATVRELLDAFLHCRLKRYGIAVDVQLGQDVQRCEGGCGDLDIAFTNIMSNAIQALAGTPAPRITIRTWTETAHVAIAVADNGPGVALDAQSRLFDPFFTTKDVGQGSGLGLFISQAVVTRRGGHIDFDPSHRGGACFVIRLPRIDAARVKAAAAKAAPVARATEAAPATQIAGAAGAPDPAGAAAT